MSRGDAPTTARLHQKTPDPSIPEDIDRLQPPPPRAGTAQGRTHPPRPSSLQAWTRGILSAPVAYMACSPSASPANICAALWCQRGSRRMRRWHSAASEFRGRRHITHRMDNDDRSESEPLRRFYGQSLRRTQCHLPLCTVTGWPAGIIILALRLKRLTSSQHKSQVSHPTTTTDIRKGVDLISIRAEPFVQRACVDVQSIRRCLSISHHSSLFPRRNAFRRRFECSVTVSQMGESICTAGRQCTVHKTARYR